MKRNYTVAKQWVRLHWKKGLLYGGGAALFLLTFAQVAYPSERMLPFAHVDTVAVGGWQKDDVVWELDQRYAAEKIAIYFGDTDDAFRSPTTKEVGIAVVNDQRIDDIAYPWWQRLIPGSLLWSHAAATVAAPTYIRNNETLQQYITTELGDSCQVPAVDASLKADGDRLSVVSSVPGGTCEINDVTKALANVEPVLGEKTTTRIAVTEVSPAVSDDEAELLGDALIERINGGVAIKVEADTVMIPANQLLSWLDFTVRDGELFPVMNSDRSAQFLSDAIAPKVAVPAGVSQITTRDFVVIKQEDGQPGRALDETKTLDSVLAYITNQTNVAGVVTRVVPPTIEYTRTYSPTNQGLSALLKNFATDNDGVYGISLVELSGERRRASVDADRQFTTASTYKLFVAYSTLKRIESGEWKWSDQITGGRDLAKCFDDMIVQSDNPCAEALLQKIGFRAATNEAKSLGLSNTTFLEGDTPLTTSGDLAIFLATLQSGQMLSSSSRERLLDAMSRNVYREGVPAGANGSVANKVGFLGSLLHDAAIVSGPNGTYVLTVMTDKSSWATIADLAGQIDKLRAS